MRINFKQLKTLPVITESGQNLGRFNDCEIDNESHAVLKYYLNPGLLKTALLISPSQIKSITSERVVVFDNVIKETTLLADATKKVENLVSPATEKGLES